MSNENSALNIQNEAVNRFVEFDKDGNGYLTRSELKKAQTESTDATSRLVAEALTAGYDWIKKLHPDQDLFETQITMNDLRRIEHYRRDGEDVQSVMDEFPKFDLNKDGYITGAELNRLARTPNHGLKNLDFFANGTGRFATFSWETRLQPDRLHYLARRSNDLWGSEMINDYYAVSMADLKVVQASAALLKKMENILNSRRP